MGMDYKGPEEYRQEADAFYKGIGIELLWLTAIACFVAICVYQSIPRSTHAKSNSPASYSISR